MSVVEEAWSVAYAELQGDIAILERKDENHRRERRITTDVEEDTRMTAAARLVVSRLLRRFALVPMIPQFGEVPRAAEPARVPIRAEAARLGISTVSMREAIRQGVVAGYLKRTEVRPEHRVTHVYLCWGGGRNDATVQTTYREKQKLKARAVRERYKEARRQREAIYRDQLPVYQQAARYAREIGCPAHGGAMIPLLFASTCCWTEFTARALAALPFLPEKARETGQEFYPLGTMAPTEDRAPAGSRIPP